MGVIQRAIDGAIAAISPQKALERAEARQQLARTRVINTGYSHYGASSYKKENGRTGSMILLQWRR